MWARTPVALLAALVLSLFSREALAVTVHVNPGGYTGTWFVDSGTWRQGGADVDVAPGTHRLAVALPGGFEFSVAGDGTVTVANGSATGGAGTLTLLTSPITVIRNGSTGYLNIHYGPGFANGPTPTLSLVRGVDYLLAPSLGPGCHFPIRVNADGTVSVFDTDAASAAGSTIELHTVPVRIQRNGWIGSSNIHYGPWFPAGDSEIRLARDLPYLYCHAPGSSCYPIEVATDGTVTTNTPSIVATGNVLSLQTTPIAVDRNGYLGYVNVHYGPGFAQTPVSSVLVPRASNYLLCPTHQSCFDVVVDAAGFVSTTGPATTSGNTFVLETVELTATVDPPVSWRILYGGPPVSGSGSTVVVPGLSYLLEGDGNPMIQVSRQCVVTPATLVKGGSTFHFGCVDGPPDDDGDGVLDDVDNCVGVSNPSQANLDGDALGDACDLDADGDVVLDADDNCVGTSNPEQSNIDGDAQGDACDADMDGDGVENAGDNCPAASNPSQSDLDGDSVGDACDSDDDGDGVDDGSDRCPAVADPLQIDQDQDGVGDACDADLDGDGVLNAGDNCSDVANPNQADLDGDARGDACDDDDDGDLVNDAVDNCLGLANADQADSDFDLFGDACDPDDDGDGVVDAADGCRLVPDPEQLDFDGDGVGDACDGDDDADGVSDEADACLASPMDAPVDPLGCTGAQLVARRCVVSAFTNHGKYVSCVAHAAKDAFEAGLISQAQRARFVANAARGN